jgi:hypothetical protein
LLSFDLLLIAPDLLILPVIFIFFTLKLVADERTGTQSQTTANRGTDTWPPHSRTNETTRRRTTESPNSGSLLSGC